MSLAPAPDVIWPKRFTHDLDAITGNLWGINPGGGRFFKPLRHWIPTTDKLDLLKAAGVTHVEAHDTDILDLVRFELRNGYADGSDEEKMDLLVNAAMRFATELAKRKLKCGMFTMNLFNSETAWNFGNFGSEYDIVRHRAIERTKKGLEIAARLEANVYVYWNGTNGTDGVCSAYHPVRLRRTRDALLEIGRWMLDTMPKTVPLAIEAKPEEPKHKMYLGTVGSVLAMILSIANEDPEVGKLLGANIEHAHTVMSKGDSAIDYAEAIMYGKLFHIHENAQMAGPGYDQDMPAGLDNPLALVDRMYQLCMGDYRGLIGIDVQPNPGDTDPQAIECIDLSVRMIKWAVEKAKTIDPTRMAELQTKHNQAAINSYLTFHVLGVG